MTKLSQKLTGSDFLITSELTPPKGTDLKGLLDKAESLRDQVTAFNLTESHAARMSMDPVAVAHLMLDRDCEPIVQMTSRDKNRIAIQASMLGAAALGVGNIVFMGGDSPKNGDHPDAKPVFDLYASQLLEAALSLRSGKDLAGNELHGTPQLTVGAVFNPGAGDVSAEIDNIRRKEDGGAEFFQTQAIFDVPAFESFIEKACPKKPVLAGVIPIKSVKMALYMNEKVPGIDIPADIIKKIEAAGDDKEQIAAISVEVAAHTIRELRPIARGIHIMAIGWEHYIPSIINKSEA
ncbi:MAG: 5,10-methylenetetrahydrofolate reductase [Acidiferrobacteraceae bacterium]|nr:5,10-methylenetetrahydrofolate reductase [Acidiferrobacteraceae bacterium]|tara:strand:- start:856 stop:1734 length:879 start_codon:yes stop_codon:yes gene_type:complete